MATANRKTSRAALQVLLEAALVGVGLPCQVVYGYRPANDRVESSATPFAFVCSAGTEDDFGNTILQDTAFVFDVHSIVRYSDGVAWNEDDAEDALDDIECAVRDMINDNRHATNWAHLEYLGSTNAADLDFDLGGQTYRHEIIRLRARYQGNRS